MAVQYRQHQIGQKKSILEGKPLPHREQINQDDDGIANDKQRRIERGHNPFAQRPLEDEKPEVNPDKFTKRAHCLMRPF